MISVIIPSNCNESSERISRLKSTLMSLEGQTIDKKSFEVIVVLNNTHIKEETIFKLNDFDMNLRILKTECEGMGSAYNYGVLNSNYSYILLGLDDIIYHEENLKNHLRVIQDNNNLISIGLEKYIMVAQDIENVNSPFLSQLIKKNKKNYKELIDLEKFKIDSSMIKNYTLLDILSITPNKVKDIYSTIKKDRYKNIHWLGMRVGNHLIHKKLYCEVNGFDEILDTGDSWYSDIEFGLKLSMKKSEFVFSQNCISYNLMSRKQIDYYNAQNNYDYLMNKYPFLEICLIPMFFAYGENYSMKDYLIGVSNIINVSKANSIGDLYE